MRALMRMFTLFQRSILPVEAMKAGASDFIEKPIGTPELLAIVARALERSRDADKRSAWQEDAAARLAGLTP